MIGLDTNVLVRYIVEDDPDQTAKASALLDRAIAAREALFLTQIVVCELIWVLDRGYGFDRERIVTVMDELLHARHLTVEDSDSVLRALDAFRTGEADFADYLILERCRGAGCRGVATFDKRLAKEPSTLVP